MTQDAMEWLKTVRKLDPALLDHMRVKAVKHPALGESVAFPYLRNGEVYAAKMRKPEPKEWRSTQGVTRALYNEDCLRSGSSPVVITEGEMDALACIQSGYERSVSLPDGWNSDGGKRDVLVQSETLLRAAPFVIVAGDNDEAGASLPKAVANILLGHDVRFVTWPDGCKDASDVLMRFGEGEVARCLVEARRIDPPGGFITGISDLPPMPKRQVLKIGLLPYDYKLAFEVGAMSVGTGTPGSGKSTFTTWAAYHIATSNKVRVGFLSFETHPHRTRDHLCRIHAKKPWANLVSEDQARVAADLDKHFRIVHRTFDAGSHNLGWLKDMVYTLAVRDNCKMIIIDPWNELEHLPEPGESMTAYINFALQQIRVWAEQFDTHICLIAHPRKMMTDGKPRSPTGYDIADSAAFFNKPSLGFSVHVDDDDGGDFVKITNWKTRDTQLYNIEKGMIKLSFDKDLMTYHGQNNP